MPKFNFGFLKNINKNTILAAIAIIAIIITGGLIFASKNHGFSLPTIFGKSDAEIGKATVDYINNNKLSQSTASLVSVSEESGLVKIKIKIGTSQFDSYVTKDGKFLFPDATQAINMAPVKGGKTVGSSTGKTAEEIIASIKKTGTPSLEAFIVARCPFGLQMQRMVADAAKNIPSLANYIKIRYIGSVSGNSLVSMHGDAEAKENLRQICIREEQPAKFLDYLSCQMKAAGTEVSCEKSTGVDSAKLSACISAPSRGIAYAQKDFDLANKYGAEGSPTLILNGAEAPEFTPDGKAVFGSSRSSDELKTIVCDASTTAPGFCSTKLNTAEAATSFSATYGSSSAAAAGNSGATGANCAPAQ